MRRALEWTPPLPRLRTRAHTTTPRHLLEPSSRFLLLHRHHSTLPPPPPPLPPSQTLAAAAEPGMDDACAVCAEPLEWVAYGACGHREVCSTCVARLRFVLRDHRCCLCMIPCPAVFATKVMGDRTRVIGDFSVLPAAATEGKAGEYWHHEGTQAWFDDADHYRMVRSMCRLSCSVCDGNSCRGEKGGKVSKVKRKGKFRSIEQLKAHLFSQHCLYMCDLCLEGRKVFICEQKLYTRSQLNQHIKTGDSEVDGSEVEHGGFIGHPMCEFCKSPFYGENELYTHMTREHYSCHICQRPNCGQYDYFKNYDDLEMHFQIDHFICEDEGCLEKKFIVFQSEAELKRHNAVEHRHFCSSSGQSSEAGQSSGMNSVFRQSYFSPLSCQEVPDARIGSFLQEASFPSVSEQSRYAPALSRSSRSAATIGDESFPPLSGNINRTGTAALTQQGRIMLAKNTPASHLQQRSKGTVKVHHSVQPWPLENTDSIPSGSSASPSWPTPATSSTTSSQILHSAEDVRAANKSLVERMRAALGMDWDRYTTFKEISGEYRQGVMNASEYLSYVEQFGLSHLVIEMSRLLPDPRKQKELADAYYANLRLASLQENGGGGTASSKEGKRKKKGKGKVPDATEVASAAEDSLEDEFLNTASKIQSNYMPREGGSRLLLRECCRAMDGSSRVQQPGLPVKGARQSRGGQGLSSSNARK